MQTSRAIAFGMLSLAFLAGPARARAPQEPAPGESAETQFAEIKADYQKATSAFAELYKAAKNATAAEREQLFTDKYPKGEVYAARVVALATQWPKDPVSADALVWVLSYAQGRAMDPVLELLAKDHLQREQLAAACQSLQYGSSPQLEPFLRTVLAQSPHELAKGRACYSLAKVTQRRASLARRLHGDGADKLRPRLEADYGAEWLASLEQADAEALSKQAEQLLEEVVAKYGALPSYRKNLGETAKGDLFELRNLVVGKPAPDIEGDDVDGQHFKLSDYRGKVVFLDFWGFW